jgi:hypothetical protein
VGFGCRRFPVLEDDLYHYEVEQVSSDAYVLKTKLNHWGAQGYRLKEVVPYGSYTNLVFERNDEETGLQLALRTFLEELQASRVRDALTQLVTAMEQH